MPGQRITQKQANLYMEKRKEGLTQKSAAAVANISARSGSKIENAKWSPNKKERDWLTKEDAYAEVWDTDVVPMLNNGIYEVTFIFEELQKKHENKFAKKLRTLQRRVKRWRATNGPSKEVMFLQEHKPGELAITDFTRPKDIVVKINGEKFEFILYHFRLPYSGFSYVQVFRGSGEPFDAFAQGFNEALQALGGIPKTHRTDSLSASFKNLTRDEELDITERYSSLIGHYDIKAIRINPGEKHENGAVESAHRHLKDKIRQSLIIRGNNDFNSFEELRLYIQEVAKGYTAHSLDKIKHERTFLRPLPVGKGLDYTEMSVVVSSTSTVDIKRVTYTLPNRLIGERLLAKIYNDYLEFYLANELVCKWPRKYPAKRERTRQVDYKHVIESLVKKPGAFYGYKLRDALLPNDDYRFIWEYVDRTLTRSDACKFIVGILYIAAKQNCEVDLAIEIISKINNGETLTLAHFQDKFNVVKNIVPAPETNQHLLNEYNELIPNFQEVCL